MPSLSYRYYRLDDAGRLHDAEWFYAGSDKEATELVRARHPDTKFEIWLGSRLVAKLSPEHFDADDPDLETSVGQRLSAFALKTGRSVKTA